MPFCEDSLCARAEDNMSWEVVQHNIIICLEALEVRRPAGGLRLSMCCSAMSSCSADVSQQLQRRDLREMAKLLPDGVRR